jgi:hypothetical protein
MPQQACLALPVLPGKKEALKKFVGALAGPKRKEYEGSGRRHKVQKETWFVQTTPMGDILLMYLEADDVTKALSVFSTDPHPFNAWVRQELNDVTGIDFNRPLTGPPPEQLLKFGY